MASAKERLIGRLYDVNALHAALAMMDWDQQCLMPPGGAEARAAHSSILSRMAHEVFVAEETQRALEDFAGEAAPGSDDEALHRVVRRRMDQSTKIPAEMVEREARLAAEGHESWVKARANNEFNGFAPHLSEIFELNREKAELLGYEGHIYNALLDLYEEGGTEAQCTQMFETLRGPVVALVQEIAEQPEVDESFLIGEWPEQSQRDMTEYLARQIGYDFNRGRQDTAPHPFCTGWSIGDIRITTRFLDHLGSAIYSTLHECGHAVYEQGSPMEWDRLPLAGGVSLGVHESQSRLWENIVGRSPEFIGWMEPKLKEHFPALGNISTQNLVRGINKVKPSFIRVEADEVTYNLHVMIRFEIEKDLLTRQMEIKDLPGAWNEKYRKYLGIVPPTDSQGCLQDVHWSMGSVGYFPTYSMGNLLSYQFWACLKQDIPDADEQIGTGEFAAIHEWLRTRIYQHGSRFTPQELVQRVTGKPMQADDYIAGLTAKYRSLYQLGAAV